MNYLDEFTEEQQIEIFNLHTNGETLEEFKNKSFERKWLYDSFNYDLLGSN